MATVLRSTVKSYPINPADWESLTGNSENYGVEESGGSLLKRRASSACSMTTAGARWVASKYFLLKASPDSVGKNIFRARAIAPLVYSGVTGSLAVQGLSIQTRNF